jgi:hypothetical protein
MQVYSDGYCPNCETRNKQASSALCDNPFVSTPFVLSYQFATLQNWLRDTDSPSACSHLILNGAFSQGLPASVNLFVQVRPAFPSSVTAPCRLVECLSVVQRYLVAVRVRLCSSLCDLL